jgi:hypothetical protein
MRGDRGARKKLKAHFPTKKKNHKMIIEIFFFSTMCGEQRPLEANKASKKNSLQMS